MSVQIKQELSENDDVNSIIAQAVISENVDIYAYFGEVNFIRVDDGEEVEIPEDISLFDLFPVTKGLTDICHLTIDNECAFRHIWGLYIDTGIIPTLEDSCVCFKEDLKSLCITFPNLSNEDLEHYIDSVF